MSSAKEKKALDVMRRLREHGFVAYLAGGCVRDRILGVEAKDYDIATNARPEVVQKLFKNSLAVGARFGVIVVIVEGDQFEVATFRADAAYHDGRRPSAVHFGTIEEDASRRDFTIGGMYFDPSNDKVIDLIGGVRDLKAGVVRAIGNPDERFAEDRLRMLRAIRFASRLNFEIEPATFAAIQKVAPAIGEISAERIGDEVTSIVTGGNCGRGMDLMVDSGLMAAVIPEMLPMIGCEQPENFHPEGDVYRHTRLAASMLPPGCAETLAYGVLFHDVAKPPCRGMNDGKVTFYGHTDRGAEMAIEILSRLRRPRQVQERVAYLVRYHLRLCMAPRMRQSTLKRMLAEEGFDELLELSRLDALASNSYLGYYHFCRRMMGTASAAELRPERLIGGSDLIALGFTPGPRFKEILKQVEDLQLEGELQSREAALEFVREHFLSPGVP